MLAIAGQRLEQIDHTANPGIGTGLSKTTPVTVHHVQVNSYSCIL